MTRAEAISWAMSLEDALGEGIDDGILAAVAGLHLHGIKTLQSCAGHEDHGLPYPWIDIAPESHQALEELLIHNPLPEFALQGNRLRPVDAPGNPFEVVAVIPDDCAAIADKKARARLLEELPARQVQVASWGELLLLGD